MRANSLDSPRNLKEKQKNGLDFERKQNKKGETRGGMVV
jgi:hypothetical protein